MCGSQREKNPDHVWSEEDWNETPESHYSRSKTLAERKAWEYAKESGLELVTIHPSYVLGPITLPREGSFSINGAVDLLNGKFKDVGIPTNIFGIADVRDVRSELPSFSFASESDLTLIFAQHIALHIFLLLRSLRLLETDTLSVLPISTATLSGLSSSRSSTHSMLSQITNKSRATLVRMEQTTRKSSRSLASS
jgi:hypothetical protein